VSQSAVEYIYYLEYANDDVDDDNDYDDGDDDVHNTRTRATTPTGAYNRESQSAHLRGWGQGGITTPLLPSIS
jgi:hypothetical protein